jgi:hypothetical protein
MDRRGGPHYASPVRAYGLVGLGGAPPPITGRLEIYAKLDVMPLDIRATHRNQERVGRE